MIGWFGLPGRKLNIRDIWKNCHHLKSICTASIFHFLPLYFSQNTLPIYTKENLVALCTVLSFEHHHHSTFPTVTGGGKKKLLCFRTLCLKGSALFRTKSC